MASDTSNALPQDWISFADGFEFLQSRLAVKNPEFMLENWNCKYINARIDMRTGVMRLQPGNTSAAPSSAPAHSAEMLAMLRVFVKQYDYSYLDRGISTGTPEGKLMLRAREIVREAEAAAANA
jgi:hypothetical protein